MLSGRGLLKGPCRGFFCAREGKVLPLTQPDPGRAVPGCYPAFHPKWGQEGTTELPEAELAPVLSAVQVASETRKQTSHPGSQGGQKRCRDSKPVLRHRPQMACSKKGEGVFSQALLLPAELH